MKKPYLDEVVWTCACGQPMGTEIDQRAGGVFPLKCSKCGHVARLSMRLIPTLDKSDDCRENIPNASSSVGKETV